MIDKNCFPTYEGKCAAYGGALFPDTVSYTLDDSLDDVIEKLTQYVISNNNKSINPISLDSYGDSICTGKLYDVSFDYQIESKSNSAEVSFNYSKSIQSLPSDFNVVKSGLELITKNGNIVNLDGNIGGVSLSPIDFPINSNFYINVNSPCGLIILSKAFKLPLNDLKSNTEFTIQDFGEDSTSTFKTANEAIVFLNEKIASLDRKVDNRTKIQNGSVGDYIYNINNNLTSALNESSSIKKDLTKSLKEQSNTIEQQIKSLSDKVVSLTNQNKSLSLKIAQLEKQVES